MPKKDHEYVCPICWQKKTLPFDEAQYKKDHKRDLPDLIMCGTHGCSGLSERVKV